MGDIEDKIDDIQKQVNENTIQIEKFKSDWFNNEQLYKMIQKLEGRIGEFNKKVDKYNGLIEAREEDRELLENLHCRINKIENKEEAKEEQLINWREWAGWIIAIVLSFLELIEFFAG